CLQSVLTQDYPDLEILVLDDASTRYHLCDRLSAIFKDPRLHCFRVETPLGVAGGRNFLMQKASGDIFCVIDDDACFADTQAVARYVEVFVQYPDVGILAAKIIDHRDGRKQLLLPFSKYWRKKQPQLEDQFSRVSYFLGGGHAVRRVVIERCGPYSDELLFGEEELDLSYRAINAGFTLMYIPDVVVHHYPQPSLLNQSRLRDELYYHVRNRFFIACKYLPARYLPAYLTIWLVRYGWQAFRSDQFGDFLSGIGSGLRLIRRTHREPLSGQAISYLKANYGRLWY
ncbi:MAG: glycosyltransferase, partial [Chloroflexi bacterium]